MQKVRLPSVRATCGISLTGLYLTLSFVGYVVDIVVLYTFIAVPHFIRLSKSSSFVNSKSSIRRVCLYCVYQLPVSHLCKNFKGNPEAVQSNSFQQTQLSGGSSVLGNDWRLVQMSYVPEDGVCSSLAERMFRIAVWFSGRNVGSIAKSPSFRNVEWLTSSYIDINNVYFCRR